MTFKRTAAATALMSTLGIGLSLGVAAPAQAEPLMQGIYNYTQEGIAHESWSVWPSCVPTVGDLREPLELAVACRLHVETTRGTKGGDARLTGGQWVYSTAVLEGIKCSDGSWAPTNETYKFDDIALTGTRSVANNEACGGTLAPAIHTFPFTLKYDRPLQIPVDIYPLNCQTWGLRLCM
ncbi:hypothetical protein B7435_09160 [Mycolicibacterium peregrinum]|uniref:Secreted protein n=1 Tax=Mycolicibacterium peregrinum TaxID=43304 RepID=A0A246C3F0_MYCPR|nr:hypothetical protein [Mycolicibacterium peregrinum]OWM05822.1 hypothetical protein B7435_09160 [Mycolicibacterium peregrinum]TGB38550.1 hypothetical protein EJD94_23945 [Mycolicibacterium peregrinum]TGB38677.1 hypothetical protein EJD98_23950 [Mycolicibacterium peregrinum]